MPSTSSLTPKVLLTGFEPFDGDSINPSWEAVRQLDGWRCGDAMVRAHRMPCAFGAVLETLSELLDSERPDIVMCVGLAGGRSEISLERIAINVDDARIVDNDGSQPVDVPVVADAPAAYFSTLPIKAIVHELLAAGIPASVSNSAGTFVCNHTFYGLMYALAARKIGTRGGFIHIPYLPEQAARLPGAPSMPLQIVVEALKIAVATALSVRKDIRETGGRLS